VKQMLSSGPAAKIKFSSNSQPLLRALSSGDLSAKMANANYGFDEEVKKAERL